MPYISRNEVNVLSDCMHLIKSVQQECWFQDAKIKCGISSLDTLAEHVGTELPSKTLRARTAVLNSIHMIPTLVSWWVYEGGKSSQQSLSLLIWNVSQARARTARGAGRNNLGMPGEVPELILSTFDCITVCDDSHGLYMVRPWPCQWSMQLKVAHYASSRTCYLCLSGSTRHRDTRTDCPKYGNWNGRWHAWTAPSCNLIKLSSVPVGTLGSVHYVLSQGTWGIELDKSKFSFQVSGTCVCKSCDM